MRYWLVAGWAGAAAMGFGAAAASGNLLIDIRGPGGTKQLAMQASDLGEPIKLDVYAQVTGRLSGPGKIETLGWVGGSFISQGTTLGDISPAGDLGEFTGEWVCGRDPFIGLGASAGKAQDIDADGDIDLGGKNGAPDADWVVFHSYIVHYGAKPGQGTPIPDGFEVLVGTITFTPTQLGGATRIRFLPRTDANGEITGDAALWTEDGFCNICPPLLGPLLTSDFILVPEPAGLEMLGLGATLLWRRTRRRGIAR